MLRALGSGASAEVFHCLDERDQLEVAIKLYPRARVREEEFRREAAIAMRNEHPNLVRLVDAGVHDGCPWLALEYVDGVNGRALLYREQRTVEQVLDLARQCFAALDAMHRAGLAHGDIKPENIIIQDHHARVVDFGRTRLAHVLSDSTRIHAGTPPYMHPDLFQGSPPSPLTDCFATWVMAYELLAGERPYTREQLQGAPPGRLPAHPALPRADLDELVSAGLRGRLADARTSWLAITRFLAGRRDLPVPRPAPPPPRADLVQALLEKVEPPRSCAVIGDPDATRPLLEALDRAWRRGGGTAVWVTPGSRRDLPLADALSLVAAVPDVLDGAQLREVADELGPLGDALAAVVPSARAWLDTPPHDSARPAPERLALAIRRLLAACPGPVLVLTRAFDRVDGASRRLLRELVAAGVVSVAGAVPPGHDHGLGRQLRAPAVATATPDEVERALAPAPRQLLAEARVLGLPFGRTLARATGRGTPELLAFAHDLEAVGCARWTGEEVIPSPGAPPEPAQVRAIHARAARLLDAAREPWLVARYAMRGGDSERLAEVIDEAVAAAAGRAPAEALELLSADPRPPTPERLVRAFRVALLARDAAAAEAALARLRTIPGASAADLAEAEGELAFRRGDTLAAIAGYQAATEALGHPVPGGLTGLLRDVHALWQVRRGVLPGRRPDPRLARIFEALYDLRFSHDNAWLLRLHRAWLQAAPDDPRALSIEVLWRQLLGRPEAAAALDARLGAMVVEERDPVGAAVVLLHRGMARLLRGETTAAFSDGIDASTRLLRAGDPYAAALATTLPTACAVHVSGLGPLSRVHRALLRLVVATGDERAARWAAGTDAVVRWQQGDLQGAIGQAEAWASAARLREDASEALARRFLAELLLEQRRAERALTELERCDVVARRLHVRMDYTEARVLDQLIADAQLRLDGRAGLRGRRRLLRRGQALVARSPRWTPRLLLARAWQALADGSPGTATGLYDEAQRDALQRSQAVDAWWALHHRALALDDDDARSAALTLARLHRLGQGAEPDDPSLIASRPDYPAPDTL